MKISGLIMKKGNYMDEKTLDFVTAYAPWHKAL